MPAAPAADGSIKVIKWHKTQSLPLPGHLTNENENTKNNKTK